ncbi:MAG: cyclic-di-AMP receptor [Thermanaerothrix sp.]|nr:cyclic-di-AMP receptor [Thermanaerothrix sp.]
MMKMIIAIVRDVDNDPVSRALTTAGFRVTCIASTGGFLRRGKSTLLVGVEAERVDTALEVIRKALTPASEPGEQRAVIFVLPIERFEHF